MSEGFEITVSLPEEVIRAISRTVRDEIHHALATTSPRELWQLWDLRETAKRLGRSERWVRERAKQGTLPRIRLDGGALMFDPEDVRLFAQARRVPLEDELTTTGLRAVE